MSKQFSSKYLALIYFQKYIKVDIQFQFSRYKLNLR